MSIFSKEVTERVLAHMNDDHGADNLLIVRAHGAPEATAATMLGFDENGSDWWVAAEGGEKQLRIDWPGAPISERPQIREQVVVLFNQAKERLGIADEPAESAEGAEATEGGEPAEADAASGHPHGDHHPHGGHPHGDAKHSYRRHPDGKGHHGEPAELPADAPFSQVIRTKSWMWHSDSEGADFMASIMRCESPLADYIALVAQHYFLYIELEAASDLLHGAADEQLAAFDPPGLRRIETLERDLQHLIGPDWRDKIQPVAATAAYTERIREVAAAGWLPAVVAHHYTRYLGDLSGGQMIAKQMRKQHGFEKAGVEFYDFSEIAPLGAFKNAYREQLDLLGERLSEADRERFLDEVRIAYEFNTAVFNDLAAAKAAQS